MDNDFETLVANPTYFSEFDISPTTGHRWDEDPNLPTPRKVKIRGKVYRPRREIEQFKKFLFAQAGMLSNAVKRQQPERRNERVRRQTAQPE